MIQLSQIKININSMIQKNDSVPIHGKITEQEMSCIQDKVCRLLKVKKEQLIYIEVLKKSVDARKKPDIFFIYTVNVKIDEKDSKEKKFSHLPNIKLVEEPVSYLSKFELGKKQNLRPIIVGSGPAGLFCAYALAKMGFRPIILERGSCMEKRIEEVNHFWDTSQLNESTNVQFGEGGAGTFSDGKLNTLVKDVSGRNHFVLDTFIQYGASEDISYLAKPHIGTDVLRTVVMNMRNDIISFGGEFRFDTKLVDFDAPEKNLKAITLMNPDGRKEVLPCNQLVLAIGHSARDTFEMLFHHGVIMEQKAFAIGVRIEHLQDFIGEARYGESYQKLPPADYKVTHQTDSGRGVYSFCMCPGGFVVNSSSEKNHLVVNGMSNYDRNERNANSACIVTVTPKDFMDTSPLAGVAFQRTWEHLAYEAGKGKIPVQLFADFEQNRPSTGFGTITPCTKGMYELSNLRNCLPTYVSSSIIEGIHHFDRSIGGFADENAILSGVETRTSSPVRIVRNENLECSIKGIYPCGEGAGYAGGIMSAAMDGLKIFEKLIV